MIVDYQNSYIMEVFTKNPGFQHIAEDIFKILSKKSLVDCRMVNKSWKTILNRPMFWLKKLKSETTLENFKSWEILVHDIEADKIEEDFGNLMIKMSNLKIMSPLEIVVKLAEKKGNFLNLISFILEHVDPESNIDVDIDSWCSYAVGSYDHLAPIHLAAFYGLYETAQKLAYFWYGSPIIATIEGHTPIHCAARSGYLDIVKFLAPFTNNPNFPNKEGHTPIHNAAIYGHLETVEFLVGLTDTPLAVNNNGTTPIISAAVKGHLEIVKFLVVLTDTPLAANDIGRTPIHAAAVFGHLETLKFLVDLTNEPLAPDNQGLTPIHYASDGGHLNIVQFLVTLTKTPNVPDHWGRTPISLARNLGHKRIVEFLEDYCKI